MGDLLYATIFSYFALNNLQDDITAQTANMVNYRLPSYGTFSTNLQTQYWFGVPRDVSFAGLTMDVDRMANQRVSKSNNRDQAIAFQQATGARVSAMEHLVPEQMFRTEDSQAHGISAVKAIASASAEGQKIWTIDRDNVNLALSQINLNTDTERDIRNAVNAGKIVTTHEARINFHGWIGEGYIILDPNTGAGAYMIAGGGNGGEVLAAISALLAVGGMLISIGQLLEAAAGVGRVFAVMGRYLGPLAVLFSVVDAKLSGCGIGASLFIFAMSFAAWSGVILLGMYILPLLIMIAGIILIAALQYMFASMINRDFCDG